MGLFSSSKSKTEQIDNTRNNAVSAGGFSAGASENAKAASGGSLLGSGSQVKDLVFGGAQKIGTQNVSGSCWIWALVGVVIGFLGVGFGVIKR